MPRSNTKLPLEIRKNEKARRVTFVKGRKGLITKASELSKLCDVQCGVIVFEKKPNGQLAPELVTYPDNYQQVKPIIDRFVSKSAKVRKVENLADYFDKHIMQAKKETALRQKNNEALFPSCNARLDDSSLDQLLEISKKLDRKIEDVRSCFAKQNGIEDYGMGLEYSQMVAWNQNPNYYEEQSNNLGMFHNNMINNYDQNCFNGMTWEGYNVDSVPYGNMSHEDLTMIDHMPLQTVYPISTSYLCDNSNPFWN